jgi:predicted pyridoxine 5'-phosphate oxidase superfamily flavin-nucleotide-binding protein
MPRAFPTIAFTPAVRALQTLHGSREAYARLEQDPDPRNTLGPNEIDFLAGVDTFFLSSVGEDGWPYVQHKGGPAGFLRVLDARTLAFADFSGNRQYISTANIATDGRVMLIAMDFANRRRMKIWGRARTVEASEDPAMVDRLLMPGYPARVERAVFVTVEALDRNCSQHITQRFTEEEFAGAHG